MIGFAFPCVLVDRLFGEACDRRLAFGSSVFLQVLCFCVPAGPDPLDRGNLQFIPPK